MSAVRNPKMPALRRSRIVGRTLLAAGLLASTAAVAQFTLDFYTIDGGGEILMESDDQQVQVSGTLGQWDGTELVEQSGGGYTLTGGFWPVNIDQTDLLFRDGFEG